MNMQTRTKRTRGTENPDAFIQLNMRIVRVAHFSFITQVERHLCIVNRGYLLLQSNSEEIEQISFVQQSLAAHTFPNALFIGYPLSGIPVIW
jgi:hypothetical protein